MQSLIRSKSAGVTGGRGTAGAGPGRDLLYGSRGVPAAPTYRRPGDLGPYEPCSSTPRVRIVDSVETTPEIGAIEEPRRSRAWRTPEVEARREIRLSGRGGLDMEDLVSMCELRCRKACNLRSAAEDSEETCHSGSSGGRARRYWKRGSPKPTAGDAGAMDTDPSPVRLWDSGGHSEGYRIAYEQPLESEETARPPTRANTAPEPSLEHDAEALERSARARTAPVARHTEPPRNSMGDTPMAEESEAPGTAGRAGSGGKHAACHCEQVSFLMGKYPRMGMDAIVHRLHSLDNAKDSLEEDLAGIMDDQSAAERNMAELRAERDRYRENLELALEKQQRVADSLLQLVEDMSGRLKRLEELQPPTSVPELPAKPAAAELVERVKTLKGAMGKPMGGPAEAPYAPPRVDPGALPFVPMFSESTMLGEQTAPAGSMREGHVTTDPRSLTVQMSHAAQHLPITTTAHAVYAEEEIQSQKRTMGSADRHGWGHPGGNLWAKDPNTGIWTAAGASPSRIPNPMGSGPTGPHSMEERDVRGVYSHPPATGGIRLGGVVAGDVGDAIRIDDLRGIKIPYYDGNPSNLDDSILDWEDFAEEVVGEMRGAPRDKWVCRTFPNRLAQDLKEELRDQIREGLIRTEQACLQWFKDEERVDAPNQKLEDLWSIPLPLDRGELRVREWNRYLRKYRRSLKLVEDWNEASEIRHLLKDVLPGHWKRRVEDEEKKRAKKRVAVRIMAAEDTHAGIMEFFRRNLGEPKRMLGLKNAVYVEVFGDTMGQRLMRLNSVEWRRGEQLRMQVILARMSLDKIVKLITVELKLNAKNEAHLQDRQGYGQRGHREDRHHREIQEDTANSAEDGSGSGQDHWSREDHEEAHFFAFVAHNVREHGQDWSEWNRVGPKKNREPRRMGNPPLSFREYRSQHDGCWVCYGKGNNQAHDHRQCKVYEADKKAYFAAHQEKKPKEQRIADWNAKGGDGGKDQGKGQGKGRGRGYGGGPGQDRRVRSIEEVAEDMLRTLGELKAQQRGGQSPGESQPEGAMGSQV